MKRFISFWMMALLAVVVLPMTACSEDDPSVDKPQPPVVEEPILTLTSDSPMSFTAEGGEGVITYTLENPQEDTYVTPQCAAEWVTELTGGDVVNFVVLPNEESEPRATTIRVVYGKQSFEVTVEQAGKTENPDPDPDPDPDPKPEVKVTYRVEADLLGDPTRVTFNDGVIVWSGDEVLQAYSVDADGNYRVNDHSLYDESDPMASDFIGLTEATFTGFDALATGGSAWFAVGSNIHEYSDAHKFEFIFPSAQVQTRAGEVKADMLSLVSDRVALPMPEVEEGVEEVDLVLEATLRPVGALLCFVPYSSGATYAAEQVISVALHAEHVIAGTAAAMAYNFAEFYEVAPGYQYWQSNNEGDYGPECALIWDNTSTSITTTLEEPLALEGQVSAEEGKGVYMSVAPMNAGKCTYVVTTDQAIYTFNLDTTLSFGESQMLTILLDLDSAQRIGNDDVKGDLMYEGGLAESYQLLSSSGEAGFSWWYARTRDTGADWVTREGNAYPAYYENVTFEVIDHATGEAADWLSVHYRANDTWWDYVVSENTSTEPRSATVTATFGDVNGYLITEACRTKSIQVTQAGFSTVKTLSFFGGVGDQTISGGGVTNQSLGYCVIVVDGFYAESWTDDKNNEQLLYSNVEIVCRAGSAEGPEVDWLTVEYGKDADGKINTTHLMATAPANTSGTERKALVCCTYHAPEGYQFEDGSSTSFRQFFVTQPSDSGVKTIDFWGGLASEYTFESQAYTASGLSYWVAQVEGVNATDWTNDANNEQAIYGGAEFTCYDFTNGVRGEVVDWVKVDYKSENGRYIDTWWLADIEANDTGVERRAEVVCTFPEIEGYVYAEGKAVRSTVIIQKAAAAPDAGGDGDGDDDGGDDVGEVSSMSYTLYNNAVDGSNTTGFGPAAGSVGDWYRFEGITINGKSYLPGDEIKNLASNEELMGALMAQAFSFGEVTDADVQVPGVDPLTANPESFVTLEPWSDGGAAIYVRIVLTNNDSGARRTFKIITKDGENNQLSSVVYFQNM